MNDFDPESDDDEPVPDVDLEKELAKEDRARENELAELNVRIRTRCPACHNQTLALNDHGELICTWLTCPEPTAIHFMGEPPAFERGFRLQIEAVGRRQSDAASYALRLIGLMLTSASVAKEQSCGGAHGNASGEWLKLEK